MASLFILYGIRVAFALASALGLGLGLPERDAIRVGLGVRASASTGACHVTASNTMPEPFWYELTL